MNIAIQGQSASYHDIAAHTFFGANITTIDCATFAETFQQIESGEADYAVVAIENSLYGPINPVYDLLLEKKPWVTGEIYLRIEHCLIGTPEATLDGITQVHSQVMAIAQCENWLENNLPNATHIEQHDTTASVVQVKNWADPARAAIASRQAAELHDMQILVKNIEDHHQNFTRFFVLQNKSAVHKNSDKTSIVIRTPSDTKPGSLYRALGVFANRNINVYSLQSRPIVGSAWHYMFYIDVGAGSGSPQLAEALQELKDQGCEFDVLGSYKNGLR